MASITEYLAERLKLKVNQEKSAVDRPWKRSFLSYSTTWHRKPRLKVAKKAVARLKAKLRTIFRRGGGEKLQAASSQPEVGGLILLAEEVRFEELDDWLRRKLRRIDGSSGSDRHESKELEAPGIIGSHGLAFGHKRRWPLVECRGRTHEQSFSEMLLRQTGPDVVDRSNAATQQRTSLSDTEVRTVVWENGGSNSASYAIMPSP